VSQVSDVLSFILWYLVISALGWITFPLTFRFFPKLASKGYAVSKPLGLLVWGFIFWLLCTLGVLQNNLGGQILALIVLAGISAFALLKGGGAEITTWIKTNWKSIVTIEGVFLVFFVCWAVVRAANPEITATEKPMELAFINSILRSPTYPPQDPWLSGYAISYYYFGYVLVAMLIRVTGVISGVGYNLAAALWFALTAIAAFGMVFDIIAFWKRGQEGSETNLYSEAAKAVARLSGILGSLFVLVVSNIEGLLEILSGAGIFWSKGADGTFTSKFWSWLDILDLNAHEAKPLSDYLGRFWGWWRGSRVLQDYKFSGVRVEIIDEFPFFSYLLSDLHPHVLAMPFDLLAMAIALNLFIAGSEKIRSGWSPLDWFKRWEFWLTALVLGSMAFLNTWDFPIYVGLYCLVLIYIRVNQEGWSGKRIGEFLLSGLIYGVTGIALFLPFFLAFKSQAGGFLPSMEFVTRGVHFWVMFSPLLIPILSLIHI
jgi:YYY domain-containing protein